MPSHNHIALLGNLTRDPELKYTANNTAVTELSIAVNENRKSPDGQWTEEVTFVDVTLWGRTAEIAAQYLAKGSSILVEGRLKLDAWTDPDGNKRQKLKVVANSMQMLGPKRTSNQNNEYSQTDDDVPF